MSANDMTAEALQSPIRLARKTSKAETYLIFVKYKIPKEVPLTPFDVRNPNKTYAHLLPSTAENNLKHSRLRTTLLIQTMSTSR